MDAKSRPTGLRGGAWNPASTSAPKSVIEDFLMTPAAPGAERHLRELRDDDDILRLFLSPPPFQWCLSVGGASAAPPFRADVANGGSGHLFRQPRGGSRGGAAVAVAPSQLGGAWGAERLPAIPRDNGPHPSRMPRPRCPTQAPDGRGGWQPFCASRCKRTLALFSGRKPGGV